jgi:hypothetical protein
MTQTLAAVAAALRGDADATIEQRVRAVVRAIINAFHGRQRARKAVIQAVLAHGTSIEMLAPIAAFLAQHEPGPDLVRLAPEQRFVLSRALMGAVRAAVREEQPFFKSRTFEDELVRLVLAYVQAVISSLQRQ